MTLALANPLRSSWSVRRAQWGNAAWTSANLTRRRLRCGSRSENHWASSIWRSFNRAGRHVQHVEDPRGAVPFLAACGVQGFVVVLAVLVERKIHQRVTHGRKTGVKQEERADGAAQPSVAAAERVDGLELVEEHGVARQGVFGGL